MAHGRLKRYSYRDVIKVLDKLNFRFERQRGSHIILKGSYRGIGRTIVVPRHREISVGTLKGILFQAGITVEEFVALSEKG